MYLSIYSDIIKEFLKSQREERKEKKMKKIEKEQIVALKYKHHVYVVYKRYTLSMGIQEG